MAEHAQISFQNAAVTFVGSGTNEEVEALRDIVLDIPAGEFVMLLGPSGCGKSTLMNLVAGFIAPTVGAVLHNGKPIREPSYRRPVVFQEYALFPWKTVFQNVEFGLKARGMARAQRRETVLRLLQTVGLSDFSTLFPHEISGGMQQRAAIARAIAPDPEILLMDEPFGALDAQTRVLFQEEIARIAQETKKTVIFVTHSIDEAVFLGDRIVLMSSRPGRIREIYSNRLPRPRSNDIRSSSEFHELTDSIWRAIRTELTA